MRDRQRKRKKFDVELEETPVNVWEGCICEPQKAVQADSVLAVPTRNDGAC